MKITFSNMYQWKKIGSKFGHIIYSPKRSESCIPCDDDSVSEGQARSNLHLDSGSYSIMLTMDYLGP